MITSPFFLHTIKQFMGFKLHLYCFLMLITTSVISYGQNSVSNNIPSKLQAKIPFETEHGSIILKVRLNNNSRILRLLFDTGADGMAIDQSTADSIGLKISRKQNATVVGGIRKSRFLMAIPFI